MEQQEFNQLIAELEQLESKVREFTSSHKKAQGKWDRKTEKIMDKLILLGSWVHDYMHNHVASPDIMNPVYKRSMLRRVRMALKYSF